MQLDEEDESRRGLFAEEEQGDEQEEEPDGMVEEEEMIPEPVPVERKECSLVEISILRSHWRLMPGQERMISGSALASNWRFHLSFNDSVYVTRPIEGSTNLVINEYFISALRNSLVGILLVEVRNLMDVTLAMGGIEVSSANGAGRYAGPDGFELQMSGPIVEGSLTLRVVVRSGMQEPIGNLPKSEIIDLTHEEGEPSALKKKKMSRSRSMNDLVEGTCLLAPVPPLESDDRVRVEPLALECIQCHQRRRFDNIVALECGHSSGTCRRCFRSLAVNVIQANTLEELACSSCGTLYSESDLYTVLSGAEMDRFHELQLQAFLDQDDRIVRCPNLECQFPMERMLTLSLDLEQVANAADGSPLEGEALRHYNEFRIRCPKCASDFCSSCLALPYHVGYTCAQLLEFQQANHCRFCGSAMPANAKGDVCGEAECLAKQASACSKVLACTHKCGGCKGEKSCLPCLHEDCDNEAAPFHGSDFCSICWVEDLQAAPCVLLACGHVFHYACAVRGIDGKWSGDRITFGYLDCPLCKVQMKHPLLAPIMEPHLKLFDKIRSNAVARLKIDGMLKDEKLITPGTPYYKNPELYAMHSFAYYVCFKCKQSYFGGRRNCEQNLVENRDPSEMVCFDCGDVPKVECKSSKEHAEFHEWKCRYCCSIAIWFCWGNTHFCEPCHQRAYEFKKIPASKLPKCMGKEQCPLRCDHPPAGAEFSLGCGICNNDASMKRGGKAIGKDKGEADDDDDDDGGVINSLMNAASHVASDAAEAVKKVVRRRSSRNLK